MIFITITRNLNVITLIHYIFLNAVAIQSEESIGNCLTLSTAALVKKENKVTVLEFDSKETCLSGCKLVEGAKGCEYSGATCDALKVVVDIGNGDDTYGSICWKFLDKG